MVRGNCPALCHSSTALLRRSGKLDTGRKTCHGKKARPRPGWWIFWRRNRDCRDALFACRAVGWVMTSEHGRAEGSMPPALTLRQARYVSPVNFLTRRELTPASNLPTFSTTTHPDDSIGFSSTRCFARFSQISAMRMFARYYAGSGQRAIISPLIT